MADDTPATLTVRQTAKALQTTPRTVAYLIECGRLQAINLRPDSARASWRIPVQELGRFLADLPR
jgi:hypothetical protein